MDKPLELPNVTLDASSDTEPCQPSPYVSLRKREVGQAVKERRSEQVPVVWVSSLGEISLQTRTDT
jgi:hypothetical protein